MLAVSFNAFAEDDKKEIEDLSPLQVTSGKTATASNDTASAVTVVTRDEISQKPNALLPDLLREETGVYIQQTTPGQGIPIIRGLKGSQNVHLIDGMRLNTAFFRNSPNQYMALVDPFMTEQIEVVRGPASVLYGGDALGGVVNVITHTPDFVGQEIQMTGQMFTSFDTADNKWLSHIDVDLGNEKIATTMGLSYQDIGERTTGSGQTIPFTAYSARAFNNKWVFNTSEDSRWLFDVQYLHQPATPRVDDLVAGFGQSEPDSSIFLFRPNERVFSHLAYASQRATAWFDTANVHLAYQKIKDGRFKQAFGSSDIDTEQNASELLSFQTDFSKVFGDQSMLIYGLDAYHDTIRSARQRTTSSGEVTIREPRFPDDSTMRHVGLFADYHMYAGDHEFTVGARYSDYLIDLNSPSISDDRLDLTDFTWHASWLFKLNENHRLFANLGRGFRPPNIFDLGQVGERPGNRFNVINPNLNPETVMSLDFGWKHAGNGWQAELVGFVSDYQDVISSVLTGEQDANGFDVVQSQNIDEVRIWGIEAELNYYFESGAQIFATATHTHGTEDTPEGTGPADRIPPTFGVLGYQQSLSNSWHIKSQIRYASTQDRLSERDQGDPRINPFGTGGFVVYDTHFTWYSDHDYRIRMGIENLFDKKYREHASGLDAPGRNYHVSFHYQF